MREDTLCLASERLCAEPCSVERLYSPSDEIEAYGEVHTLAWWARERSVSISSLRRRFMDLAGLPAEVVIALPTWSRVDPHALPGEPHAWTWDVLCWEDDEWAQAWVARHPGGATLEEVGAALGIVRERVRQVEESAMRKFQRMAERMGVSATAMLEVLSEVR